MGNINIEKSHLKIMEGMDNATKRRAFAVFNQVTLELTCSTTETISGIEFSGIHTISATNSKDTDETVSLSKCDVLNN